MSGMTPRTLLVGIDEAGYGPILGPLSVSAAAFDVPGELTDASLWAVLHDSVTHKVAGRGARLVITDSKKLHKPKEGIGRIERTALAALAVQESLPVRLSALLERLCPDVVAKTAEYPWYRAADPALPLAANEGSIRIAASVLRADLARHDIRLAEIGSEILLEGHYNRLVGATQNKAVVLLGLTLRLMQRIADAYPAHTLRFFIDKQGARDQYAPILLRTFEDRRLRVLREDDTCSAYELHRDGSTWDVSFTQSGESHHLPTALASIVSKYLREALMGCFNAYWQRHVPFVRPTAGYYQDGLRFLKEIAPHSERLGVSREWLVRQR
jgi:ribonuclease HII